jgi:hypothetical protein
MENPSQSLDAIAENWYARLNRLKSRHQQGNLSYNKEVQIIRLIGIMIGRMIKITPHYVQARQSIRKPGPSFPSGGIVINEASAL